jgi:phosphoribosylformylglycinamidine synthase
MEGLFKMTLGNRIGCRLAETEDVLFAHCCGGLLLETLPEETEGTTLGVTTREYTIEISGDVIPIDELERAYDATLEPIYPTHTAKREGEPTFYPTATRRAGLPYLRRVSQSRGR